MRWEEKGGQLMERRGKDETRRTVPEPVIRRRVRDVEMGELNPLMSKEEVVRDHNTGERTVRKIQNSRESGRVEREDDDDEVRKHDEPKENRVAGQDGAVREGNESKSVEK